MNNTTFQTFDIPAAATVANRPLAIAIAGEVPARVLVRNVGPGVIFVAADAQDTVTPEGPGSKTFQVLGGNSEVFVIAPKQRLFATGAGPGGILSVTVSDALPLV
jgi:hypothetical protein